MSTVMDRKVVVIVTPRVSMHPATGTHIARIAELGLTAYGASHDDAVRRVKGLFDVDVRVHRSLKTLDHWLKGSGLTWWWFGDHPDYLFVEHADGSGVAAPPKVKPPRLQYSSLVSEPYPHSLVA